MQMLPSLVRPSDSGSIWTSWAAGASPCIHTRNLENRTTPVDVRMTFAG